MNKPSSNEWMRDVELSQRNIVFPDTAANEARFWRNFGSRKLSAVQVVGFILICAILVYPVWRMAKEMTSLVGLLFLAGCGACFLLLRWRVSKVGSAARRPPLTK